MAHTNRYHMQEGGAMVARGSAMMPIAAGRGLGGGTLVNSAICFRTPDAVLSGWTALLGDDRYGPAKMAPIFEEIEQILQVGPTHESIAGENNLIIVRGAKALGLPGGLVRRNTPGCQGCAQCNVGCPVGAKASVDRNLIPMAVLRGAIVQADVKVDEVLITDDCAVGVAGSIRHPDTRRELGRITVRAPAVFVCCGGVGTPRLLAYSGIANRLGPAVGEGLHVHPGSAVLGRCRHKVKMWHGATQGAFFEHPDLPGVLPHTLSAPPGALILLLNAMGIHGKDAIAELPYLCGCVVMVSDQGVGRVGATSDGRADLRYWFDDGDVERIKRGMVETARVLQAGGATTLMAPVHGVGMHETVDGFEAALADRTIEDFTLYASHPMASCRMGLDANTSVVGPTGEAHRLPGLFVADSSVFPTSLGVNPQLTTATLATAIARGLVG
jgi:choline dehydrogenase-like flavoprotein